MKYQKLGQTDMIVSKIGFGASVFANFYLDCDFKDDNETIQRIDEIINLSFKYGINYYDTAPWYGKSEELLGKTLGKHPRKNYYIATKVGRYSSQNIKDWFDFSYDRILNSVDNSIKLLNCEYIDLIQVHDFEFAKDFNQILNETLPALDLLRKQGKVKYIGINSYSIEHIRKCLEQTNIKIDTILTFCHACLDDSSLLDHIDFFKKYNVGIINASPMSMGLFTDVGAPKWHRAPPEVKAAVASAFEFCKERGFDLKKFAFIYSVNQPEIDLTVSSASSVDILNENMDYYKEGLNEEEFKILEYIREKIFKPLNYQGYGDIDVKHYYEKLDELNSS